MAQYTFKQECDVCGNRPVLVDTGMCAPCTWGEADSMWEWLDSDVVKTEKQLAATFVETTLAEMKEAGLIDKHGEIDPIAAVVMHIDREILDKFEELM